MHAHTLHTSRPHRLAVIHKQRRHLHFTYEGTFLTVGRQSFSLPGRMVNPPAGAIFTLKHRRVAKLYMQSPPQWGGFSYEDVSAGAL